MTSLVVGGTGMLAQATHWLVGQSSRTVIVSRRATRFPASQPHVVKLDADWNDPDFVTRLAAATGTVGSVTRALLWLHDVDALLPQLLPLLAGARTVLVLGSTDGRPALPDVAAALAIVRLGSVRSGRARRWLTHEEISQGAIAALRDGGSRTIGELLPP